LNKFNEAKVDYLHAIDLDKKTPVPYVGLAQVMMEEGDLDAARDNLYIAWNMSPSNSYINFFMAKYYLKLHNYEKCLEYIIRAESSSDPLRSKSIYWYKGEALAGLKKYKEAAIQLRKFVNKTGIDPTEKARANIVLSNCLRALGDSFYLAPLLDALSLDKNNYDEIYTIALELTYNENEHDGAKVLTLLCGNGYVDGCTKLLDGRTPEELFDLGKDSLGKGLYSEAVVFLEGVVDRDPLNYKAYAALGDAYRKKGDRDKAVEYYSKSLEIKPGQPFSRYVLARSYIKKGDRYLGLGELALLASSEPDFTEDLYSATRVVFSKCKTVRECIDKGKSLLDQSKPESAMFAYNDALDRVSKNSYDTMDDIRYEKGKAYYGIALAFYGMYKKDNKRETLKDVYTAADNSCALSYRPGCDLKFKLDPKADLINRLIKGTN
jgi:tetratricopeptide (TPR) repeat protein